MISLVVATLGRKAEPMRLLTSLNAQIFRDFEVILVDQNPHGFLEEIISCNWQFPLKHLYASPQGVSVARNLGLAQASGKVIGFPDDDCWYESGTLQAVAYAFRPVAPLNEVVFGQWQSEGRSFAPACVEPLSYTDVFRRGETYVQFYRRDITERIGKFDPHLGPGTGLPYGCGEDTDYALRALELGCSLMRDGSIKVWHPSPEVIHFQPKKIRSYAEGRMYLLRKHRFSWSFRLLNILYPLLRIPLEGPRTFWYRLLMFWYRLRAL